MGTLAVVTRTGSMIAWTVVSVYTIYLPPVPEIPDLHPWCKKDFGKVQLGVGKISVPWVSKNRDPARG